MEEFEKEQLEKNPQWDSKMKELLEVMYVGASPPPCLTRRQTVGRRSSANSSYPRQRTWCRSASTPGTSTFEELIDETMKRGRRDRTNNKHTQCREHAPLHGMLNLL